MNPKVKIKVAIDLAMSLLFLLLMNTAWTGVFLHEWIGIGIMGLFFAHLFVNRQWIGSILKRFQMITGFRAKFSVFLNALLTLAMAATMVSGILISQYLFAPLAAGNVDFWYTLHAVSSWLTLVIVLVHTVWHWRWIQSVIRRIMPAKKWKILAARVTIGALAVVSAYSLINNSAIDLLMPKDTSTRITGSVSPATSTVSTTESTISAANQTGEDAEVVILPSETAAATVQAVTLQEYLSKLYCTACPKHCLLTNPRCGRGVNQAEQATEEYYGSQEAADGEA